MEVKKSIVAAPSTRMCGARCHFFVAAVFVFLLADGGGRQLWRHRRRLNKKRAKSTCKVRRMRVLPQPAEDLVYNTYMVLSDFMWGIKTNRFERVIGVFCFSVEWFKRLIYMREGEVQRVDLFCASAHGDPASRHISLSIREPHNSSSCCAEDKERVRYIHGNSRDFHFTSWAHFR
jgi:hypothetical protein